MSKFVLTTRKNGQFQFVLKSNNGETILSSEGYKEKRSALKGIASVQKNGGLAERYNLLSAKNGKSYFNLRAGNHQVIGTSEMYASVDARKNGIKSVMKNSKTTKIEII